MVHTPGDPVAFPDAVPTPVRETVEIPLLVNPRDVDGDSISVAGSPTPAEGTAGVNPSGTIITYTSSSDFTGTDAFTYMIQDETGAEATGSVTAFVYRPISTSNTDAEPTIVAAPALPSVNSPDGDVSIEFETDIPFRSSWTMTKRIATDPQGSLRSKLAFP